jgi:replicative DNA helicase
MTELYNDNKPIDLLTVQEKLKEKDVPPEMSGLDFIREIVENVPTSANVKAYAAIVHEKAAKRRLIKVNEEIANTCYADKEDMDTVLGNDGGKNIPVCCSPEGPRISCRSISLPKRSWTKSRRRSGTAHR